MKIEGNDICYLIITDFCAALVVNDCYVGDSDCPIV